MRTGSSDVSPLPILPPAGRKEGPPWQRRKVWRNPHIPDKETGGERPSRGPEGADLNPFPRQPPEIFFQKGSTKKLSVPENRMSARTLLSKDMAWQPDVSSSGSMRPVQQMQRGSMPRIGETPHARPTGQRLYKRPAAGCYTISALWGGHEGSLLFW